MAFSVHKWPIGFIKKLTLMYERHENDTRSEGLASQPPSPTGQLMAPTQRGRQLGELPNEKGWELSLWETLLEEPLYKWKSKGGTVSRLLWKPGKGPTNNSREERSESNCFHRLTWCFVNHESLPALKNQEISHKSYISDFSWKYWEI